MAGMWWVAGSSEVAHGRGSRRRAMHRIVLEVIRERVLLLGFQTAA
jgi:hypothetical protein